MINTRRRLLKSVPTIRKYMPVVQAEEERLYRYLPTLQRLRRSAVINCKRCIGRAACPYCRRGWVGAIGARDVIGGIRISRMCEW